MKTMNKIFGVLIFAIIILSLYQDYSIAEETVSVQPPDFSITEVKTLGRNLRNGEMTVIYATVECAKPESLPTLDLFYITSGKTKSSVLLEEKIFNVIPMFCMDTDLMTDRKVKTSTHLYRAEIPPQKSGCIIEYFIQAKDVDSSELVYPPDAPVSLKSYTISDNSNPFKSSTK